MVWCPLLFLHPQPFLSGLPLLRSFPLPVNLIHGSQSLGNLHLNIFPTQYLPPFFCPPRHMCTHGTTDLCPKEPWLVPIPNLAREHPGAEGWSLCLRFHLAALCPQASPGLTCSLLPHSVQVLKVHLFIITFLFFLFLLALFQIPTDSSQKSCPTYFLCPPLPCMPIICYPLHPQSPKF